MNLVISDQHSGLVKALKRAFQGVAHQRCRVHVARNLITHLHKGQADYVAAAFRMIFAQPTAGDVHAAWDGTRDELAARFPKLGPLMDEGKAEATAFTAFPREHWRRIWLTNPLEWVGQQGNQAPQPGRGHLP
ncbi:transposase [Nocardioides carbamazepini]|uniref:transposase n=1 Tax=Nocardioides carbamazepini TaxID=2854259 RepID=UPI0021499DCA|nr:transposase [Nocardioides carbamazepini]